MNNHCLQQQSVNSARTENILNLTIRTWWLRSWSVKTFSKSICLARQLKYYLPSLVTISISHILGDTWPGEEPGYEVVSPFACSNFLCYSAVPMQAQPLPHEEKLSIVSNLSFVKRGYFEFFWEVFWSETRTEGKILLDFLFQESDIKLSRSY